MDEVVMENVVLKGFPLFDVENIEVIRGPQGTLFGRNTTAGIIKINTRRPSDEYSGYVKGSYGRYATINLEGAVGGSLIDGKLTARASVLSRSRDNWITNGFTGEKSLGRYDEKAGRLQFEWTPTDNFSAHLLHQNRRLDGTSSIFRANVFDTGSNALNQNYDRDTVYYDGGDDNPQEYKSHGSTLTLEWAIDETILTSITSYQAADGFSRGDIDGGVVDFSGATTPPPGISFDPAAPVFGGSVLTYPGTIMVPSVTQDGADTSQFTQELRLASDTDGRFNWQIGWFFFDSDLVITTDSFASFGFASVQDTKIQQKNEAFAVFGQGSYDVTDRLTLTAGVRYTDDEKSFNVQQFGQLWLDLGIPTSIAAPVSASDEQISWDIAANFAMTDNSSIYMRAADGFRAQTIQGRDVAFLETPTVAEPETIQSIEAGYKADLMDGRARINFAVFHYEVEDMQLSIIGGASNTNQVFNAARGVASGYEFEADFLLTEYMLISVGTSYNDTELQDENLFSAPCGSGLCTVLDPVNPSNSAQVSLDGNPFPRAPKNTYNLNLRVHAPVGSNGQAYAATDVVWYGDINMPLYEAEEFRTDGHYEAGIRIGYMNDDNGLDMAVYARNLTDQDNVLGFVDFSNNTGFVNEPQTYGFEVSWAFGD
jgi:iron complex outermembrane receptor protein